MRSFAGGSQSFLDQDKRPKGEPRTGHGSDSHNPLSFRFAAPFIVRLALFVGLGFFGLWLGANQAWHYLHDWRRFYGLLLLSFVWFGLLFYLLIGRLA